MSRRLLALLAAITVLAGCGSESEPQSPRTSALTLALDFTPNAAHAPIYAAARTGADRRNGVALRILEPGAGGADSLKLVASGRADVGVLDIHDLGLAAARGADVVGIGALVQKPLAAVIARGGVARPRDLAGRTVGVTGLPSDVAVLKAVVSNDGGNFDRVEQRTIGFSAVPQLIQGSVDAVTAFWNAEGVVLRQRGQRINVFRVDRYGAPPYPEVVFFVRRRTLAARRSELRGLMRAVAAGVRTVRREPAASVREIAKASNADEALVQAQLDAVLPLFEPPVRLDRKLLGRWADWDTRFGILPRRPDVDRLFDTGLAG